MDKRFLNKVVNQIVYETMIDYSMGEIQFPFSFNSSSLLTVSLPHFSLLSSFSSHFSFHCKNVYGLNEEETEYVWKEYVQIIKDKIR